MGKQWKQWETLFWGGSKITADGNCSHEIKRRLLLGRKTMTNLGSTLKSRHYFANKGPSMVKTMVFQVVMFGCESWTIKKTEHQRIDEFELWCWKSLLRVPWNARRSNQSILKEINEDLFCIVLLCILATTSYLLLLLGPYHFCPFSFFLNLNLFILIGG